MRAPTAAAEPDGTTAVIGSLRGIGLTGNEGPVLADSVLHGVCPSVGGLREAQTGLDPNG